MKVVHVSTYDAGGAANAMIRLHKGLLKLGLDSFVLTSIKTRDDVPFLHQCERSIARPKLFQKILSKIGLPQTREQKDWWITQRLTLRDYLHSGKNTGSAIFFSINSPYRLEDHPLVKEADIIHLHWVSGFVNYPTFFKKTKKPIVWTFHDKGVVLGGFHLLLDYEKSSEAWKKQSDLYQQKKKEYIQDKGNIAIVAPSKVLLDYSRRSFFSSYPHYQIYYGIDTGIFSPMDVKKQEKTSFLAVGDMRHYHKGFDILLEALKFIRRSDFEILIIGNADAKTVAEYSQLKFIGKINEDRRLAYFYNLADAVLVPSREDNFPNVMIESLACGTPVIATPVGGMLDIVENNFNGYLSVDMSPRSFADVILKFLESKNAFDRNKIREKAMTSFSPERQASSYLELYKQILNG